MDRSAPYAHLMPVVIAHVSDIHVDSEARAAERTRRVFAYLDALSLDLDAVVVTGDIADHGLDAEYETVRKATRTRHPLLICPAHHSTRGSDFRGEEVGGHDGRPVCPQEGVR